MNIDDTTPSLVNVIISAFTLEAVVESSPGVYTTASWPSYITNTQTADSTIFTLTPDVNMVAEDVIIIRATA